MTAKGLRGQELTVEIYRDGLNAPWGFRLYGGTDFESPLIVQKVTPASAAAAALQVGDVITKINDINALTLKHAQVLDLITATGGSLKLTILRETSINAGRNYPQSISGSTEDDKQKVPKLADIMKESLKLKEQGQLHTIQTQGFRGTPLFRTSRQMTPPPPPPRSKSVDPADITAYLPQMPPKRAGSRIYETFRNNAPNPKINDYLLSQNSSGRSSPNSSVIELGETGAPKPIGVWIPPAHQPNAKLVHLQYNTPLGLYSAYNVADSVEKMTGTKIEWVNQHPPNARYVNDIRESPTYKFIQEIEGGGPSSRKTGFEQSRTIKNLNRHFRVDDDGNA